MRDRAQPVAAHGADQHAPGPQRPGECIGAEPGAGAVEEDEVAVDARLIEGQGWQRADRIGEAAGVGVILGEARDMVIERVETGGGKDAGLPHGAAEALLPLPRGLDEGGRAGEDGADRAAQPLAEIQPDRIEGRSVAGGIDARFDDRVHEPRAVHVEQEPALLRRLADRLDGLERPDRAAALVRGLLDHREP